MADSKEQIVNLALRFIGDDTRLAAGTFASDPSKAAKTAREFFDICVVETQKPYSWGFSRHQVDLLPLLTLTDSPTRQWGYAYRLPSDCIQPRQLVYGLRAKPLEWQLRFEVRDSGEGAWDATADYVAGEWASFGTADGFDVWYEATADNTNSSPDLLTDWVSRAGRVPPMLLYADVDTLRLEYTRAVTDVRRFPLDFTNAVAARLAYYLAPVVTKGDTKLAEQAVSTWQYLIAQAEANDANGRQRDPEPPSSFEIARMH